MYVGTDFVAEFTPPKAGLLAMTSKDFLDSLSIFLSMSSGYRHAVPAGTCSTNF